MYYEKENFKSFCELGNLNLIFEKYENAINYYEKALKFNNNDAVYNNLGVAYLNNRDYKNAIINLRMYRIIYFYI